jgi:hypothetical protein
LRGKWRGSFGLVRLRTAGWQLQMRPSAPSAPAECVVVDANALRSPHKARSHRFRLHNVKQRSLLRSRGAFPSAGSSLPLRVFRPEARGGGAPETGHWHFRRACEAQRLASRATGGRLAALQRGDFRPRDQRFMFRQCPPESAPRLRPRPGITPGRSGLAPPAAAVRSAPWDATSPLSPQGISGDAPHERGCGSIAWMRLVVNIGS